MCRSRVRERACDGHRTLALREDQVPHGQMMSVEDDGPAEPIERETRDRYRAAHEFGVNLGLVGP